MLGEGIFVVVGFISDRISVYTLAGLELLNFQQSFCLCLPSSVLPVGRCTSLAGDVGAGV